MNIRNGGTHLKISIMKSFRKYRIQGIEPTARGYEFFDVIMTLEEIIKSDSELCYSIQDEIDELLDLKHGKKASFRSDRNDRHSAAVAIRIN